VIGSGVDPVERVEGSTGSRSGPRCAGRSVNGRRGSELLLYVENADKVLDAPA